MGTKKRSRKIRSRNKRYRKLQKALVVVGRCAVVVAAAMRAFHTLAMTKFPDGGVLLKQKSNECILNR